MMNKIIRILRLSRLVLLVILLLIAVVAKIARAETAYIYTNHYGATGYFGSAAAACAALPNFPGAEACPIGAYTENGGHCFGQPPGQQRTSVGLWSRISKTCDPKELSNPNPFGEGLEDRFFLSAPQGIDAADWYSDRFTSCENNCIVKNTRVLTTIRDQPGFRSDGRSILEDDGISWSWFKKRQTGEVCVVEKQKPDDPPKPPRPDTGDGADGNGQGGAGSDNGQSDGSGSSGENGSQGNSSGSQNQGSGNSDGGGSGSSGSGSGSGGVNGSGGQTGPSGGGTSGGTDSGSEGSGSEGGTGDGQSGDGEESGGSGDSGGQGGANSGGQGNVGGDSNNGQDGQPGGTGEGQGNGEGDGQGSISGGSCEANQAPDCKGDPIQCYIAREQWRTACAAAGQNSNVDGGDCASLTPPKCEGDATQCYIAKQQFFAACEAQAQREGRDGLKEYAEGKSGIISDVEGASEDGVNNALEANSGQFDMTNIFDLSGFGLTRGCPAPRVVDMGDFGQVEFDTGMFCTFAQILGNIFVGLTMLWALRYVFA